MKNHLRSSGCGTRGARLGALTLVATLLAFWPAMAPAAGLVLATWSQDPAVSESDGQSLAAYLQQATGIEVRAVHAASALEHWQATRRAPGYDLVLDGAQFSDYRVQRFGFEVIAKLTGEVGYTVVTAPGTLVTDIDELAGRPIAIPPAPGLAALSILSLFADSMRAPRVIAVRTFARGIARLMAGSTAAAVIPSVQLAADSALNPLLETEKIPAAAFSVAAHVEPARRTALADALISAATTPRGRRMLARAGLREFVPASATLYAGYARLLKGAWGYAGADPSAP